MRIITGKYKGRHFQIPKSFSARPTTDFAKENLFNVLRAYVDWEDTPVLDLFGGTGSMSMEFLSRGCPAVVTVEMDRNHAAFISQCCRSLGDPAWTVVRGDALKYVARGRQRFPLIFADPPYALPELPELPERLAKSDVWAEGGIFVLEHGATHSFENHPWFLEHRAYGSVNFSFFRKPEGSTTEE